ncbi:MAG: division/cell wall cluster transcriptional repressor MraZ [Saprospiraceae bacterium]
MYNLLGEYRIKIDEKGRIKLPKDLIRQLNHGNAFPLAINRGYEKHLMLYPKDVWDRKTKEINQLDINKSKERQAMRYFYRGASSLVLDSIDRVLLPKWLVEYASISKEVVLFAYGDQIELWDHESYEKFLENEPDNFDEIMDGLSEKNQGQHSTDE